MNGTKLVLAVLALWFSVVTLANYRADINRDGTVNFLDVAEFSSCFLESTLSRPDCASEDVNLDGAVNFQDLAVVSSVFLSIRPNSNNGARFAFSTANTSGQLAAHVVDLDSDGDLDVVGRKTGYNFFGEFYFANTGVYLNDGQFNFTSVGIEPHSYWSDYIILHRPQDFGDDGMLELIKESILGSRPVAYTKSPGEDYQEATFTLPACGDFIRVLDVNQDGQSDVICFSDAVGVGVHLGNGGDYSDVPDYLLGGESFDLTDAVSDIEILDVNSDGFKDVLVTTFLASEDTGPVPEGLKIYLSDQVGQFVSPTEYLLEIPKALDVLVADFDGDSVEDFVVYSDSPASGRVHVYLLGSGAPVALPFVLFSDLGAGVNGDFTTLYAADTDGDGDKELIAPGVSESFNDVLRFIDVNPLLGLEVVKSVDRGPLEDAIFTGYVNDDAVEDLLSTSKYGLVAMTSEYPNSYKAAESYRTAANTTEVATLYIDDDQFVDTAVTYFSSNMVGTRSNVTGKPSQDELLHAVGSGPVDVFTADLNADGHDDIVAITDTRTSASVLLSDGAGGFFPFQEYPLGADYDQFEIADINGDGFADMFTGRSVLLGSDLGEFGSPIQVSLPVGWTSYAFEHMNADSFIDLVYATKTSVGVILTSNDCVFCGGTTTVTSLATLYGLSSLAVGDLDNDLDLDLVVTHIPDPKSLIEVTAVSVDTFVNNGANSFTTGSSVVSPKSTRYEVELHDIDQDGWTDIVTGDLSVLYSDQGGFSAPVTFHLSTPRDFAISDLDLDGAPDVAYVEDGGFYILRNRP